MGSFRWRLKHDISSLKNWTKAHLSGSSSISLSTESHSPYSQQLGKSSHLSTEKPGDIMPNLCPVVTGLRVWGWGRADLTRADRFIYRVTWPFRRDCQLLIWGFALKRHQWRCCLWLVLSAWHALQWQGQTSGHGCWGALGWLIGKIQNCGQHHSLGWDSGLSEKENSSKVPALTSLCFMTADVYGQLPPLLPLWLPCHCTLYPRTANQNKSFLP